MKFTITNDDGKVYEVPLTLVNPTPTPVPKTVKKFYSFLNVINWGAGLTTSLPEVTEASYFVLPVSANGTLTNGNEIAERKFIADCKAKGIIPTFSIAGGTQNIADITKAVTQSANLCNAISARMPFGYGGVTLDIEHTSIPSLVINNFISMLRNVLGSDKVIGIYTQPGQLDTVWKDIGLIKDKISWLSPMLYDTPNTVSQIISTTKPWADRVGKDKILLGAAPNYDATGFDIIEWPFALDIVNEQGWKGVGLWNNVTYTKPYQDIMNKKA